MLCKRDTYNFLYKMLHYYIIQCQHGKRISTHNEFELKEIYQSFNYMSKEKYNVKQSEL